MLRPRTSTKGTAGEDLLRRFPPCPHSAMAVPGRFGSACGAAGGRLVCRAATTASNPRTLHALTGGVIHPRGFLWEGFAAFPRHGRLPCCAPSEEGESSPLSSLGHKYLAAARQLAGTGPTPACQIRPAVPVTHHPSPALLTCCRQLLSLGPARKGPGAGWREGATAKFSNNALPPNLFPSVASSRGAGSHLMQPEDAQPDAGPGSVLAACSRARGCAAVPEHPW